MGDPAVGNNSVIVVDFEQSWGVAKGSPKGRRISVVECGIVPSRPLLQNPSLRSSFNPSRPFLGQPKAQGPLTLIPNVQVLPFIHKWATGVLVKSGAAKATGSIVCVPKADLIDGETVTLDDGVNDAVVFEFDVNGTGVSGSNVQVNVSAATTAADVAAALHAAINGVTAGLAITSTNAGGGTLTLQNDAPGTAGNVAITDTVADTDFVVTGMTGGAALPYVGTSRLGTTMPKSAIVEASFDIGGTIKYGLATGVRINGWTIPIAFEGPLQISLDTMAKNVTYGDTPYDASPDDWTVEDQIDHMHLISGHIKVDGASVGWVKGGQLQGAANLKDDFRASVLGRGSLVPGTHGLNGNLQVALESEDVLDFVSAGGDVDLEFLWQVATNQALKVKYHVRMEITGPPVRDGLIDVPVNFQGFEDPLTGVAVEFATSLEADPDTEYV